MSSPRAQSIGEEKDAGLKSGLYALIPPDNESNSDMSLYLIFWPEDTTWDDDAPFSVSKNRVTFMQSVSQRVYTIYVSKAFYFFFLSVF
jgi:hypothetical protein